MAKKSVNYFSQVIHTLQTIHREHPTQSFGNIISTALDEYKDIWGISDREVLHALEKYKLEQEYNKDDLDIEQIVRDGKNLSTLFDEEENEEV
jgi:hypothetical protein